MDHSRNYMGPVVKYLRDSSIDKKVVHDLVLVGGSTSQGASRSMKPDEEEAYGAAV